MLGRCSLYLTLLLFVVACVPNNVPLGPEQFDPGPVETSPQIEVARESVFVIQGDERQLRSAAEQTLTLAPEEGVAVDDAGRAIVRFADRLTVELLPGAELLQIQPAFEGQSGTVSVAQNGGTLVADLTVSPDAQNTLIVQTAFGTVTGVNARFAVVREADSPLEWVLALDVPEDGALEITGGGVTVPVPSGQARWFSANREPSQSIILDQNAQVWLENARNNIEQPELGAVLLPPANILAGSGLLPAPPSPGRAVEFGRDVQGAVQLTADPVGIFGSPAYTLEDCNADGRPDLAIRNGILAFDFSQLLARVQALDITLFNRAEPGSGLLQTFDPAGATSTQQQLTVGPDQPETLSVRNTQPFQAAKLTLADACLLGLSLTPPGENRAEPPPVRAVAATPQTGQDDVVVNVLSSSTERSPENGQFQAPRLGTALINIDGTLDDWDALAVKSGIDWVSFDSVVHDDACATRFPEGELLTDLGGQVQFAYDDDNLYVAFLVADDGLVTYSGSDYRYFLGDSPQLLLDVDLTGDFDAPTLSGDDVQVDLLPQPGAGQAALWQLSTLTAGPLSGAQVAAAPIDGGYFVEAALPWASLGATLLPGDRLGLVAGLSDNDTPAGNAQECIITTTPRRDWRNPTTWGTILLLPTPVE